MEWKNTLNYLFIVLIVICGVLLFIALEGEEINLILTIISSVFILAFTISLFVFNKKGLNPENNYLVQFDGIFVSCFHSEKGSESIKWNDITEVLVNTTDKGPHQPYIWILLTTDTGKGCRFPIGAKNSRDIVEKILGLEGCDLEKWGEAMKSTDNKRFSIWKK